MSTAGQLALILLAAGLAYVLHNVPWLLSWFVAIVFCAVIWGSSVATRQRQILNELHSKFNDLKTNLDHADIERRLEELEIRIQVVAEELGFDSSSESDA
jgi:hypothetical protein